MKIELRSDSRVHIEGYVNAVERDSRIINVPSIGQCVEQIRAGAFENALRAAPDVLILENHDDSRRLGSVSEGNLSLYEDNIGLRAIADIDDENIAEKARNGKIRGWSFGFVCTDSEIEQRSGNVPRRIVKALSLSEVSLIDGGYTPCYNGTLVEVRSGGDFIEYRSGIDENVETDNKTDENGSGDDAGLSYYDAVIRSFEMRYNPYHDPGNGRFCSGGGSGGGSSGKILYVPDKKKGGQDTPDGNYIRKPEGIRDEVWKQLKQWSSEGKMPTAIMGNYDNQAIILKAINQLYPEVSHADRNNLTIENQHDGITRIFTKGRTNRTAIPKGYENDADVVNGTIKWFTANIKRQSASRAEMTVSNDADPDEPV